MNTSFHQHTPVWKKSSKSSTGPDSNCVEITRLDGVIAIRDSKLVSADNYASLTIPANEWNNLLANLSK